MKWCTPTALELTGLYKKGLIKHLWPVTVTISRKIQHLGHLLCHRPQTLNLWTGSKNTSILSHYRISPHLTNRSTIKILHRFVNHDSCSTLSSDSVHTSQKIVCYSYNKFHLNMSLTENSLCQDWPQQEIRNRHTSSCQVCYFCTVLIKIKMYWQISVQFQKLNFMKISPAEVPAPWWWTDMNTGAFHSCFVNPLREIYILESVT